MVDGNRDFNSEAPAAYAGLHESSLAVALAPVVKGTAQLNVLLPELSPAAFFAGIRTATEAAVLLAAELDLPLRFVALHESGSHESYAATHEFLVETFHIDPRRLTLVSGAGLVADGFTVDDRWLATYWTTAHALDVACRSGIISRTQVVYLVQDYEPGFFAWSSESSIAASTYHAGFAMAVNSIPLRDYLVATEDVVVGPDAVFAPNFDVGSMKRVAASRRGSAPHSVPRILFYGRPGKPRNMFTIGVAALRLAIAELASEGKKVVVISAGQPHPDIDLGHGTVMASRGTLDWLGYCNLVSDIDVGLSLQKSAHPSHPPLEMAMSGAWAVTNEFAGTREGLHPRLLVRHDDPMSLAAGIMEALRRSGSGESARDRSFVGPDLDLLGRGLGDVMSHIAETLRTAT